MADQTWKHAEREVAKRFGTERTGPLGERCPDAISKGYAIEVKHRKRLPHWLLEAMDQAERNGGIWAPDCLPVVVLHQKGQEYDKCLVVVRLDAFLEWFGE